METIDWADYRKCRVCRAATGQPCFSLSGQVVAGRPDGIRTELAEPHRVRIRRKGR